ncbi:hypothetical protein J2R80_007873 [Bradyrhizobium sp. USDA 4541]|nr:hypothetical protein [Bradyrhizobium sp. USDA 4541]
MQHAAQTLCPVLAFRKENDAVPPGLLPLLEKMKRQHAKR